MFLDRYLSILEEINLPKSFYSENPLLGCAKIGKYLKSNFFNKPKNDQNNNNYGPGDTIYEFTTLCNTYSQVQEFEDKNIARITASPLLEQIKLNFSQKNSPPKYSIYSANENFLASLLVTIGSMDPLCIKNKLLDFEEKKLKNCKIEKIPPASSFTFLLYSSQLVDATFNGESISICSQTPKIEKCEFQNFEKNIQKNLIFPNYKSYCGLAQKDNEGTDSDGLWD